MAQELQRLISNLINRAAADPGKLKQLPLPGGATLYLQINFDGTRHLTIHRPNVYPDFAEAAVFLTNWNAVEPLPSPFPTFAKETLPAATQGHGYALVTHWRKPDPGPNPPVPPAAPPQTQLELF